MGSAESGPRILVDGDQGLRFVVGPAGWRELAGLRLGGRGHGGFGFGLGCRIRRRGA